MPGVVGAGAVSVMGKPEPQQGAEKPGFTAPVLLASSCRFWSYRMARTQPAR